MKQDRFLLGIVIGIVLLGALAVGLFFVRQAPQQYVEEDNPEGVIHNYILALQEGDFDRAYKYLANLEGKPSRTGFDSFCMAGAKNFKSAAVRILDTQMVDNVRGRKGARVVLSVRIESTGLFSQSISFTRTAELVLEGEDWRLAKMPSPFWGCGWYPPPEDSNG